MGMSNGWIVALWLAMGPHASAVTAPPPQSAAAAATARALAKAVETSARLAVAPRRELGDPRVPDVLQPHPLEAELDRTLHRQIGDFVEAWLREHGADAPIDRIAEELELDLLWGVIERESRVPFEGDVKIGVARPADDPALVAVSWKTQLAYLGNSSLHVYTTGGGRVERVLEWSAELAGWPEGESPGTLPLPFGPTDVLHDFGFRLGGRDERGDFYVAAAWSEPSPASSWGAVSWVVLANGSRPRSPRVVARGSDGAWHCYEDECYILGLRDDDVVTLDYNGYGGELAVCNGFTSSDVQRAWRLVDGEAEELRSTRSLPFPFVSDWLDAPWREARRWSAGGRDMRRWHRLLSDVACLLERGREWVDSCRERHREVLELVLVTSVGGEEPEDRAETRDSLYFVFDGADAWRLAEITPNMPAGKWQSEDDCYPVPDEPAEEPVDDAADEW